MKNDSVNLVRSTIRDVEMGGYIVPKGSFVQRQKTTIADMLRSPGYMVYPMTYQSYRSTEYLSDPDEFDAKRWIGTRKAANTTGPGYLAFGIGRWACPGRFLAVMGMAILLFDWAVIRTWTDVVTTAEIKCWILALVKASRFELEGGRYEVVDPYNITSVPPRGRLLVQGHPDEASS